MHDRLRQFGVITDSNKINSNVSKMVANNEELRTFIHSNTPFISESRPNSLVERIYCLSKGITAIPICIVCDAGQCIYLRSKKTYSDYCSKSCALKSKKRAKNRQNTMMERHGVKHALQSATIREKFKQTMVSRYDVPSAMLSDTLKGRFSESIAHTMHDRKDDVVHKRQTTMNERYGVKHALQSPHILDRVTATSNKVYNRRHHSQIHIPEDMYDLLSNKEWLYDQHVNCNIPFTIIAENLGVDGKTVKAALIKFGIPVTKFKGTSFGELDLCSYIESLLGEGKVIANSRDIIAPYELDIFIPEHNLAIEYCGLYWHSSEFKTKDYHKLKFDKCKENGIQLLTIFDDEWKNKREIVQSLIAYKLGIIDKRVYGRNTTIKPIGNAECFSLLEKHHIQGKGSGKIKYGIFCSKSDELIGCAIFKRRSPDTLELVRYATTCQVIGGLSKILKHLERNESYNRVVTFSDNRISTGNMYYAVGFSMAHTLPPDYQYVINNERYHKFNFRHARLKHIVPDYDVSKSETELTESLGINRIYDCGKQRFELCQE